MVGTKQKGIPGHSYAWGRGGVGITRWQASTHLEVMVPMLVGLKVWLKDLAAQGLPITLGRCARRALIGVFYKIESGSNLGLELPSQLLGRGPGVDKGRVRERLQSQQKR